MQKYQEELVQSSPLNVKENKKNTKTRINEDYASEHSIRILKVSKQPYWMPFGECTVINNANF